MDEVPLSLLLSKAIWAGLLIALGVVIKTSQHEKIRHFREENLPYLISILKSFCEQVTKPFFGLKP
jgi:hypothetical protein